MQLGLGLRAKHTLLVPLELHSRGVSEGSERG